MSWMLNNSFINCSAAANFLTHHHRPLPQTIAAHGCTKQHLLLHLSDDNKHVVLLLLLRTSSSSAWWYLPSSVITTTMLEQQQLVTTLMTRYFVS